MADDAAPRGAIGLFGGTFDPVHVGHLRLAEEAREMLGLARVTWIPAGNPPLRAAPRTAAADRLAMVRLAVAGNPAFDVDPGEAHGDSPSYTVDTLRRWRAAVGPAQPLVLLLGMDAFSRLEGWHRWRELFALAHLAVATRPGSEANFSRGGAAVGELSAEFAARRATPAALATTPAGAIVPFALTPLDVSATAIRARLASGGSARYLVADPVLDYIRQRHLY